MNLWAVDLAVKYSSEKKNSIKHLATEKTFCLWLELSAEIQIRFSINKSTLNISSNFDEFGKKTALFQRNSENRIYFDSDVI